MVKVTLIDSLLVKITVINGFMAEITFIDGLLLKTIPIDGFMEEFTFINWLLDYPYWSVGSEYPYKWVVCKDYPYLSVYNEDYRKRLILKIALISLLEVNSILPLLIILWLNFTLNAFFN